MYQAQRLEEIMVLLQKHEDLTTEQMIEHFNVSRDTVRRDFAKLANEGKVKRVHGGIMALNQDKVFPFNDRLNEFTESKKHIAELAKDFIKPNGTYFFDVSTTVLQLAQLVDVPVTIYTHSLDNAIMLSTNDQVELHTLGGKFFRKNRFFYSLNEAELLQKINFDAAFIGAAGLKDSQVSFENQEDAYLKKLVLTHTKQKFLLAEKTKFAKTATYVLDNLASFDYLITNEAPAAEIFSTIDVKY